MPEQVIASARSGCGSLNQRGVLERRVALVEQLYVPEAFPQILRAKGK